MDLYKSAVTDENGQFSIQGISPGTYKLFSWDYASTGAWFDADFIRGVESRGTPLSITTGKNPPALLTGLGPPNEAYSRRSVRWAHSGYCPSEADAWVRARNYPFFGIFTTSCRRHRGTSRPQSK